MNLFIEVESNDGTSGAYSLGTCEVSVIDAASVSFGFSEDVRNGKLTIQNGSEKSITYKLATYLDLLNPIVFEYSGCIDNMSVESNEELQQSGFIHLNAADTCGNASVKFYGARILDITVRKAKYRALVIGEYNKSGASNDLPFASNNVSAIIKTLEQSSVDGERYEITPMLNNPTRSQIGNAIVNTFADAADFDVSFIYIVSHGYYNATTSVGTCYYFSIAPSYSKSVRSSYVTSSDLMGWLSKINGNVVLALNSCKSGGFIKDQSSKLDAAGNISVLTAQPYNKNGCYFKGDTSATQIEFMTYAFCEGLGCIAGTNAISAKMPAISQAHGSVSVAQAFNYTKNRAGVLAREKYKAYPTKCYIGNVRMTSTDTENPQVYLSRNASQLPILCR